MYDYGEACPISRASRVLCERWTLQIVREMMLGATRFSEFQRYLPRISPSLLSKRLTELERAGLVEKVKKHSKLDDELLGERGNLNPAQLRKLLAALRSPGPSPWKTSPSAIN